MAHRLLLPWETLTPISTFLRLLVFKVTGPYGADGQTDTQTDAGARVLFLDWGVEIMRATFRGVHKSVINDNKNTLLDLV